MKIWNAQKVENIITLKNGDAESVFIFFLLINSKTELI